MSNADDICRWCETSRAVHPFRQSTHAFVEPAPQPEPSGDEAKVREIVEKWMDKLPGVSSLDIEAITKAGYAAGKADGAREERTAIRTLVASFDEDTDFDEQELLDDIADAIARRGSEGK